MKKARGRPTSYKKKYDEQARKLCLLGATTEELADFFDVAESTVNKWIKEIPSFSEAVKASKRMADAEIVNSLYNRAKGVTCKEIRKKTDGSQEIVERELPPDPVSMIFWLKNRQPDQWRDKQKEDTQSDSKAIYVHNSLYIPNSIKDGD